MKSNGNEELENLLHNIAWLRRDHGLSKKEMAKRLGISIGTLNKIEKGVFPPRLGVKVMGNILFCFGIPLGDQLGSRLGE